MPDKTTFIWEYFGPNPFREGYEASDEADFKAQVVEKIGDRCASGIEHAASEAAKDLQAARKRVERYRATTEESAKEHLNEH